MKFWLFAAVLLVGQMGCRSTQEGKNDLPEGMTASKNLNTFVDYPSDYWQGMNVWHEDEEPSDLAFQKINSTCKLCDVNCIDQLPTKQGPGKRGLWDQGSTGSCFLHSLLNSNILIGADDTDNKFANALADCMDNLGFTDYWKGEGPGFDPGPPKRGKTEATLALLGCKAKLLAKQFADSKFDVATMLAGTSFHTPGQGQTKSPCDFINDAMANSGVAVLGVSSQTGGSHAVSVKKPVICEPKPAKIVIIDPNDPDVDFACDVTAQGQLKNCKAVDPTTGEPVPPTPAVPPSEQNPEGTPEKAPPTTEVDNGTAQIIVTEVKSAKIPK